MLRTHTCGELREGDIGKTVTLAGWVHRRRDHGGVVFFDLRDRYGMTQVTVKTENKDQRIENRESDPLSVAETVRPEYVVQVTGIVAERPAAMVNTKLPTGTIEVEAIDCTILNTAKTPPFEVVSDVEPEPVVREEMRMKYRYIDLRSHRMKENIVSRAQFIFFIREFLTGRGFVEVETPMLGKRTPEGARDFIVPSRLHPGKFYALPQSPQQYKQLLMIAGMDRYFQIARCIRDEDTRGERQAEFTQLDLEMSFVEREDILDLIEELFTQATEQLFPEKKILRKPWPRLTYNECMERFGSDKPDLRFGLEIQDVSDFFRESPFEVFRTVVSEGGVVRAIVAKGASAFSRSQLDELTEFVKPLGLPGLAYMTVESDERIKSPLLKFIGEEGTRALAEQLAACAGDIIFFGAGGLAVVRSALAELRVKLGRMLGLIDPSVIDYAFVIDFPLFVEEKVDGFWAPSHHMFTAPKPEDIPYLATDPGRVRSLQYDLIGNGHELGGGSIRIHDRKLQETIFGLIGFTQEQKKEFAHMLEAFEYGAPPHGGIAPGLDRILMVLRNQSSIREVICFPKTGDGRDLLMDAPSDVSTEQLKEVHIKVVSD